jgi:hypothetical protein
MVDAPIPQTEIAVENRGGSLESCGSKVSLIIKTGQHGCGCISNCDETATGGQKAETRVRIACRGNYRRLFELLFMSEDEEV